MAKMVKTEGPSGTGVIPGGMPGTAVRPGFAVAGYVMHNLRSL